MAQYRQSGADRLGGRSHLDFSPAEEQIGIRIPHKSGRIRRGKPPHRLFATVATVGVSLLTVFFLSLLAFHHLSSLRETSGKYEEDSQTSKSETRPRLERSLAFKELRFGRYTGRSGRDSRYWDGDDRRRDDDYSEDDVGGRNSVGDARKRKLPKQRMVMKDEKKRGRGRLYNEGGREELDSYNKKYEDSLKNGGFSSYGVKMEKGNTSDDYDDGIDEQDENEYGVEEEGRIQSNKGEDLISDADGVGMRKWIDADISSTEGLLNSHVKASGDVSRNVDGSMSEKDGDGSRGRARGEFTRSVSEKKSALKRKAKHKSSRSSCEMKFLNSTTMLVEPLENKKFSRFSLQYTEAEERPSGVQNWEPRFAGHQTLQEINQSYYAHDQKINCGFIKGPPSSPSTGFDMAEDDLKYMSSCHIAVSSCIFGNSDHLRTPYLKTITRQSRKNICFIMFVDENTLKTLQSEGQKMDSMGFIGLWKIVVIRNLPYPDMRRVGKIPKLLAHRLFPSARYSIWLDSKLRLQNDPYLILEYFLWRRGYEYAISNHYDRHCVWEEVAQNKKLNKYNHTVIDQQFEFYQSDGLKRFDPTDPNKLLPSYVPEGSFIARAHTPMSNLFSCLWFNEVDQWTPRDQLSFAYTYLKLRRMNPEKNFHLNMFKDCERRSVAKLFHHRAEDKQNIPFT
ncbi:hypothetical protein HPP92_027641 [Vanilla planifolia]|uniref:TOD1/MUCI70 glycosyltransferase-like domain-containing protein n=1 Tax=Vanilla planifolia TaxID=51239 RepID=A0A835P869_VANPL|nr:hypothetical protein HPP92_027641 [Vanilla planifolia]